MGQRRLLNILILAFALSVAILVVVLVLKYRDPMTGGGDMEPFVSLMPNGLELFVEDELWRDVTITINQDYQCRRELLDRGVTVIPWKEFIRSDGKALVGGECRYLTLAGNVGQERRLIEMQVGMFPFGSISVQESDDE